MPEPNIHIDEPMNRMGQYLMNWLNSEYSRAYPVANGEPQPIIVQSIRDCDAFGVPYDEYPLLKCYRMFEDFSLGSEKDNVTMIITYGLVYPEQQQLTSLLVWVRRQIAEALRVWKVQHAGCTPVLANNRGRAEYRTMLNELTMKVHGFLRITLNVVDY